MSDLDDVIKEFLVESNEGLDRLDQDLVALEQDPNDRERLARVFRVIHTVKGTCGFFGFSTLESVTHAGESVLSKLRDGALALDTEIASALMALVDAVRAMLGEIERTGKDGGRHYKDLVRRFQDVLESAGGSAPTAVEPPSAAAAGASTAVAVSAVATVPATRTAPAPEPAEARGPAAANSTLRVDVGLLDRLMNLVGELVLARNQILQYTITHEDPAFQATTGRLNLITTELQEGVMKTRMQPIGNVWSKLPRMVRDLATATGKQIRLEMSGKDTELDKTIIEAIKDPLTHLVRNAADHGVERPEVRRAAGKPPEGVLQIRAYHEGGQVNIEIADDGAGVDLVRVRDKLVQRGLLSVEQAARASEHELVQLIFLPGFSTAERVTNVSGRGVGMDVVKTNVEKIGGTVDVQTVSGAGTTFKIKIPLTLAIIPALIVLAGGDRYAIPQVNLVELVLLEGEQMRQIEHIHGTPVYRLRGHLLPLVYLHQALRVASSVECETANIVILRTEGRQFGLVVDAVNDSAEIVVKPLGRHLKGISTFAGATIMGDGTIALILDVLGLAQEANVVSAERECSAAAGDGTAEERTEGRELLLIAELAGGSRIAVPLSDVARLEEFRRDAVERAGAREVVQYRGAIMPLVRVESALGYGAGAPLEDELPVIVYSHQNRNYGLVVHRIVDIVDEVVTMREPASQPGLLGAAVIQGRVTDLLDMRSVIAAFVPEDAQSAQEVLA